MDIPALRFHQVAQRYGATPVLRGIDLSVGAGEFFGLVGVNGAGKTSLIKCMLDFHALDGGRIDIFGNTHRSPAARAPLAFLPERFLPPYYLSGDEFLKYVLKLQNLAYDGARARALVQALELDPAVLPRLVRSYSKGMMQKLGLAACLLSEKPMLVLDEPMSGLDPQARALFKQQLQVRRGAGHGVFFTSHALADVDELCDRIGILHDGLLRFVGTPDACRAVYGNTTSLEQAFMRCINEDRR